MSEYGNELDDFFEGIKKIHFDENDIKESLAEILREMEEKTAHRKSLINSVTDEFEKTGTYEFYKNALAGKYSDKDKGYIATLVGYDCKTYAFEQHIYSENIDNYREYITDSVEKMSVIADSRFTAEYAPWALSQVLDSKDCVEKDSSGNYVYKNAVGSTGRYLGSLKEKSTAIPKRVTGRSVMKSVFPAMIVSAVILLLLFYPPVVEWFAGSGGYNLSTTVGAVAIIIGLFTGGFWGAAGVFVVYAAGFGILSKFMSAGEYIKWIILLPLMLLDGVLWWDVTGKIKGKARYEASKSDRDAVTEEISVFADYIRTLRENIRRMDREYDFIKVIDVYYSGIIRELNMMSYM